MRIARLSVVLLCAIALGTLSACKKDDLKSDLTSSPDPGTSTVADRLKDSALAFSKDIYLWYTQIPASFNARSYAELDKLMIGLRQYSTEPGFTQPVDRWSFAIKQTEWDNISSGIAGDFGINVFFMAPGDLRVKSVEKESPAGKAGVLRGWRVTKVDGNTDITSANAIFLLLKFIIAAVPVLVFRNQTIQPPISRSRLQPIRRIPIFLDSVYTVGYKKNWLFIL
jgi:hypothetical protein